MRRILLASALMAAGVTAAMAQSAAPSPDSSNGGLSVPGIELGGDKPVDPATAEKRKEIERAYQNATKEAKPVVNNPNDPWANMRGADEAKPAVKPKPVKPAQANAQKTTTQKKATAQ